MQRLGLSSTADPSNYEVVDDITHHLHDVDFVQEVCSIPVEGAVLLLINFKNAPERPDFKTKLVGNIDAHLPKGRIIASSSSGIPSSQFIGECKSDPSRVLIGHPFNPVSHD